LHGLLIHTKSFPGWADFGAMVSHFKFVKNHHQHIAKVAAVTDSGFLTIMPSIISHFNHAEVRHFKESALTWVQSRD
jgi:peroxiredoxin